MQMFKTMNTDNIKNRITHGNTNKILCIKLQQIEWKHYVNISYFYLLSIIIVISISPSLTSHREDSSAVKTDLWKDQLEHVQSML